MFCPTMGNDAYPHLALQPTRNGLVSRYVTADSKNSLYLDMGSVKTIDRSYITDLSDRAMKDVVDENCDSAITKSRTLLEEVFCYVIKRKGENPSESGDIGKLYNQVKQLYKMHQSRDMNKSINGLLSGREKILSAIAKMRNKGSDFHGVGAKRISIANHSHPLICKLRSGDGRFCVDVGEKASL